MAIYVDDLMDHGPGGAGPQWPYRYSAHLFGDSLEELHAFAASIGCKRSWLHVSRRGIPHYDLAQGMRQKAVKAGAIELDADDFHGKLAFLKRLQATFAKAVS